MSLLSIANAIKKILLYKYPVLEHIYTDMRSITQL